MESYNLARDAERDEPQSQPGADELLRLYRQRSGLTQSELAAGLEFTSDRMIKKWEGSFNLPEPQRLRKLIELYLKMGVFISGKEDPEARNLWTTVKEAYETGGGKLKAYPIFDANWFKGLTNRLITSQNPLKIVTFEEPNHNLPVSLTSFVGRERELIELKKLIQNTRLLTLTGTGGIGKTRLALQLAGELTTAFKDGVWLVELASLGSAGKVAQAVAAIFGVKEKAQQPIITGLVNFLKFKEVLIILDNCEHLIAPCAELAAELLGHCPSLKILATSRERLRVDGETAWRVPSLSLPAPLEGQSQNGSGQTQPGPAIMSDAVKLLVDRVKAFQPDFTLNGQNAAAINELCQQLEGLPLAIELAAVRTRLLTIEQITTRLSERFRLLTGGDRTVLPRQKTLQGLIDWSYELLNSKEQKMLARLPVFAGGFTLEAAEAVCVGGGIEPEEILGLLSELVVKSLVSARRVDAAMRFSLLETIRLYGQEKLEASGEELLWRASHLKYYLDFAARYEPGLNSGKQKENGELVGRDYLNCQAALNHAINRQETTLALLMCRKLVPYWEIRSYISEAKNFMVRSLALPGPKDTADRANVLNHLAWNCEKLDEYEAGVGYASRGLEIGREINDETIIAGSLYVLGVLNRWQGNYEAALDFHNKALDLDRKLGNEKGIASSLSGLGHVAMRQSDYARATEMFFSALSIARKLGNDQAVAGDLSNLGIIFMDQGNYEQALKYFEESNVIARELGYRSLVANTLTNQGIGFFYLGNYAKARAFYLESLPLHKAVGSISHACNVLINLGELDRIQGAYTTARKYSQEALELLEETGNKWGQAICLNNLGNIAANLGDYQQARNYCQSSLTIRQELDNRQGIASCYTNLGNIALLEGDYEGADQFYGKALAIYRQLGNVSEIIGGLTNLGLAAAGQNMTGEAKAFIREVLELNPETQSHLTLAALFALMVVTGAQIPGKAAESAILVKITETLLANDKVVLEQPFLRPFLEAKAKLEAAGILASPDASEETGEPDIPGLIRAALESENKTPA